MEPTPLTAEEEEQKELDEIDELIRNASAAEKTRLKKQVFYVNQHVFMFYNCRKRRLLLKNKRRLQERKQLGMSHDNDKMDEGADAELFNLPALRKVRP